MSSTQQLVRLSVNMNEDTAEALKELAKKQGLSFTETIRRALAVYKFIYGEVKDRKRIIQTMNPDGTDKREVVLM
jgi:hypothetical protein